MAGPVAQELTRLARAWSRSEGRRMGRRVAILAMLAFLVACAVHRFGAGIPLLSRVEARPLLAVGVVLAVFVLAALTERLVALDRRPAKRALARRLDDALSLADATDAAVSAHAANSAALYELVEARAAARLSTVDPKAVWRAPPGRSRVPLVLAIGALFLLLAPGVLGIGGTSGAGRGTDVGVGRRPKPEASVAGASLSPDDADRWLREHGRVALEVPDPKGAWNRWVARFTTDAALPAAYSADVLVDVDDAGPFGPVDTLDALPALVANVPVPFQGDKDASVKERLRPGRHQVRIRLRPKDGPWRHVLESLPIEVIVPPPDAGGGGGMDDSPPQPQPQPKPPPPRPPPPSPAPAPPPPPPPAPPPPLPPPPPGPAPGTPPPEAKFHDEAVQPLSQAGDTVKKDKAVVAVRDPNAGSAAPRAVPIDEALKDFDRVVEHAVASERILPADRELVRRYLEALRRATTGR